MLCAARIEREPFSPPVEPIGYQMLLLDLRVPGGASLNHVESVAFIDPLATGVDAAIREAQRCIVEALDLDGCMLFEPNDDGDLLGTYSWWRPAVPAPPARLSARESFPWMFPRLLEGELVCLSSPDGLSDGVDRSSLLRFGLRSIVVIPLSVHEKIVGVVELWCDASERDWPLETIQRLRLRRAFSQACSPGGTATRRSAVRSARSNA